MMKFCGMVVLSLSKKFEQHESELAKLRVECARANELRLAAEAVANKSQSELGSLVAQRNKELARTAVAESKNIRLQKENERLICDNKKFSSDFAKLKEEKESFCAVFSVRED